MKIRIWQPGRFTADAWDSQLGKDVPFRISGAAIGDCRLIAADVDAAGVSLTLEIPDDAAAHLAPVSPDYSVQGGPAEGLDLAPREVTVNGQCPITGTAAVRREAHTLGSVERVGTARTDVVGYDIVWERADPEIHVSTELLDDPQARAVIAERYTIDEWCPYEPRSHHARLRWIPDHPYQGAPDGLYCNYERDDAEIDQAADFCNLPRSAHKASS